MHLKPYSLNDVNHFTPQIFNIFNKQWFLLCSGNFSQNQYNGMTISWGMMGTIWNKPIIMVMSRPQRYTTQFLDQYGEFSLCGFTEEHRDKLKFCGTKSGYDIKNKLQTAGFTPCEIPNSTLPGCQEAQLIITCKTLQQQNLEGQFLPESIIKNFYPQNDFHKLYFGEITSFFADSNLY